MRMPWPTFPQLATIPVTLTVCLVAIALHLYRGLQELPLQYWIFNPPWLTRLDWFLARWWTIWTGAVLHADWIHLLLNLGWLWPYGWHTERLWGSRVMLALLLISEAEATLLAAVIDPSPGIGLSGVVYGVVAFHAITCRRIQPLRPHLQREHELLFLAWLPIGFFLSWTGLLPIGNWAHIGGLLAGLILGAIVPRHWLQRLTPGDPVPATAAIPAVVAPEAAPIEPTPEEIVASAS